MARITEMHKKWLKEPKYKKAYDALEEEFVLAGAVMDVRNRAGLTQEELARRMGTTQPVVAVWKADAPARRCGRWSAWRIQSLRSDGTCQYQIADSSGDF